MEIVDNSFFYYNLKNLKVLVIVPHQDDEINIAGSIIRALKISGADVKVLYTTNGDYHFLAKTRIKEAKEALLILGVDENDIFFLGYNDTPNFRRDLFVGEAEVKPIISEAGYSHTYGEDYSFKRDNQHSIYIKKNYIKDMKNVILDIKPDIIFAVDYDAHIDHRFLSLTFDQVIGDILQSSENYKPEIYKAFAYSTAFGAIDDFYAINIKSTKKPNSKSTVGYFDECDMIDTSIYEWDRRVRFPVIKECRESKLYKNKIFKALLKHSSQYAGNKASRIINGDQVYWQRRTDSISYKSKVIASSNQETAYRVKDFMIINTDDIFKDVPSMNNYLWIPNIEDNEKSLKFSWKNKEKISMIRVFSNIRNNSCIRKLSIEFGDEKEIVLGPFNANGNPIQYILDEPICTDYCRVKILDYIGDYPGIAECEFFPETTPVYRLPSVLKTVVDDEFIYNYKIREDIKTLKLDFYKFGSVSENIDFEILESAQSRVDNGVLYISEKDKFIPIKLYDKLNPNIFDIISITRLNDVEYNRVKRELYIDRLRTKWICKICRRIFRLKKKFKAV